MKLFLLNSKFSEFGQIIEQNTIFYTQNLSELLHQKCLEIKTHRAAFSCPKTEEEPIKEMAEGTAAVEEVVMVEAIIINKTPT